MQKERLEGIIEKKGAKISTVAIPRNEKKKKSKQVNKLANLKGTKLCPTQ